MKEKAKEIREKIFGKAVQDLVTELESISDHELEGSVAQHVKIKVKLF